MKNIRKITAIVLSLCLFAACDVLDKDNPSAISDKKAWGDIKYVTAIFDNLQNGAMPGWNLHSSFMSDESCVALSEHGSYLDSYGYSVGKVDENSIGNRIWAYNEIRRLNEIIDRLDASSFEPAALGKLKGQALTLRALTYFRMVRAFGGVPMIMHPQEPTDDVFVKRDKASTCFDLIVKDLDDAIAIADYPMTWDGVDAGRLSKAAALALKGRVLMTWASPQFNPSNDAQRWTDAYNANLTARNECKNAGYGLFEDFGSIFFLANEMNKEVIMVTRYQYGGAKTHNWMTLSYPECGLGGSGRNNPTWELVQAFPMKDGTPATEDKVDPVKFWLNRDPRLAATIVWNGCEFTLAGGRLAGIKDRVEFTADELYSGSNGSVAAGYMYIRKAIDPTMSAPEVMGQNGTDWIELRYGEVLMNLAECAAELGKYDEVVSLIGELRKRAGIDAGADGRYGMPASMSHDELIAFIMNERKVEFAFEDKREWDLLRRFSFMQALNGTHRHGRKPKLAEGANVEAIKLLKSAEILENYSQYFVDEIIDLDSDAALSYPDKYRFFPISFGDLEKNSNLEQTIGWKDGKGNAGTFDPLN